MGVGIKIRREKDMNIDQNVSISAASCRIGLAGLVAALLVAIPVTSFAWEPPPPFVFKDRCVPNGLTDAFMLANGIDPDRLVAGVGPGSPADPEPCDEFHTEFRGGYEACHFYDGSPCYFTVNGQLDPDSFTDDEAGRRAFEIGEHFVIYEMVQNGPPELAQQSFPLDNVDPFFTNPFFGGFAVGTQAKIINAGPSYWQDNPSGIWKIGLMRYTQLAFDALANPGLHADDYEFLNNMRITNGVNSQGALSGMPLIVKGEEIFELTARGLTSIRYRTGESDGVPGGSEGPRYLLCPVHENPAANGVIIAGEDIIRAWPTTLGFQVPCGSVNTPNPPGPGDPLGRGHNKVCVSFLFGPTPPPTEQCLYDHFDCLQREGDWCGGTFKSGPHQCPPPPFVYED
jgi:hypothetical protein